MNIEFGTFQSKFMWELLDEGGDGELHLQGDCQGNTTYYWRILTRMIDGMRKARCGISEDGTTWTNVFGEGVWRKLK